MHFNLNYTIAGLSKIDSTLNASLGNKSNLPTERINRIIVNLRKLIYQIEVESSKGFTPHTIGSRTEILSSLKGIYSTLEIYTQNETSNEIGSSQVNKIKVILQSIARAANSVTSAAILMEKEVIPLKPVTFAFFLDLDGPDFNGATSRSLAATISQELPIITTVSLLQNKYIDSLSLFQKESHKYQIYEENGIVLLIPNSFLEGHSEEKKLQALDINIDVLLKKVSIENVLEKSTEKTQITSLISLFTLEPKINKVIYLVGHGSSDKIATLNASEYKKLIFFLQSQRCKGLAITSCMAGGAPSTWNMPSPKTSSDIPNIIDDNFDRPFPILVNSIGDLIAMVAGKSILDVKGLMSVFTNFINEPTAKTTAELGKRIMEFEDHERKWPFNYIKFLPEGISGGFRPINETGKGYSLTMHQIKKAELSSKTENKKLEISIENRSWLEVHPLVIKMPLDFIGINPLFISMIPGDAHHFIKAINLSGIPLNNQPNGETPQKYILKMLNYFADTPLEVTKCFFIQEINSMSGSISDVNIKLSGERINASWREGNTYFLLSKDNDFNVREISAFDFAKLAYQNIQASIPSETAVIMASAEYESELDFQKAIKKSDFSFVKVLKLFDYSTDPCTVIPDGLELASKLPRKQRENFVRLLLANKNYDLAMKFVLANLNIKPFIRVLDPEFWRYLVKNYDHTDLTIFMKRVIPDQDTYISFINTVVLK